MSWNVVVCGDGYLGSNLRRHFESLQINVVVAPSYLKRPFNSRYAEELRMAAWLRALSPVVFINASGLSSVSASFQNPRAAVREPAELVSTHLRLLPEGSRYILISSAAVYGDCGELGCAVSTSPVPQSPYGLGKLLAERFALRLQTEKKRLSSLIILRPFSIYSPSLKKRLLWEIVKQLQNTGNINLAGTGGETRDFVHINDFNRITTNIALDETLGSASLFNIGTGEATSITAVVRIACDVWGQSCHVPPEIVFNNSIRKGDPARLVSRPTDMDIMRCHIKPRVGIADYFRCHLLNQD